ncbi:MAG: glycogen/starch/alpha-glucan phosphorylase [Firmicutes bacterium]|nr:glycogen/starch/alpha-glucan phosphorylase [Bacillota bacterium]
MNTIFKNKEEFKQKYVESFKSELGKSFERATATERYNILAKLIASEAKAIESDCKKKTHVEGRKKIYYFSMEFLIGKLLKNYLINFGIEDLVRDGLAELGESLDNLCEQERDPGLGNGGLGRLAACFIDSLASLGYSGHGNGIRYNYGLFKQAIKDGQQVELPDNWLENGFPWETRRMENSVVVRFGGEVVKHYENGQFWCSWEGGETILAVPYDVPVVGYGGETVNNLRLWSAQPCEEDFDMDAFNRGDYSGAMKFRSDVEAITSLLYPNDNGMAGKILRLKQEYMFVCAGINNIVETFKYEYGTDWERFPELVAIHTNDTHPALCAPELMRVLIDIEGLSWDQAWDITTRTISYTNHTVLPEALEKWPIDMFRQLLPRVYDFVEEIDRRYRESFPRDRENWQELHRRTAILWDGQVRTANLSVIAGHSVNGVASLHTEILKHDVLKEFYELTPDKFQNKTNGITHRRFLAEANPSYSRLITNAIGNGWMKDASELSKLTAFENDANFLEEIDRSKRQNKERLAGYIYEKSGISVDCDSIFDVQVKRFHAYKRQLLNILKVMHLYNEILDNPNKDITPSTFIFAGKAAQGYVFAKDVIRLVNSVADVVNNDPKCRDKIKVAFVPNFAVSSAQLIYPAANISEQISTAGMEASGTGNMKFMMNGAITLGTMDGANVEISEQVGMDNIEIFGLRSEEVEELKKNQSYYAWDEYNHNMELKRVVDQLIDGTYGRLSGNFDHIYDSLLRSNDEFFVLKDFDSYIKAWHNLEELYTRKDEWNRISLHNTASSGFFSSDRTIRQYAEEIWKL